MRSTSQSTPKREIFDEKWSQCRNNGSVKNTQQWYSPTPIFSSQSNYNMNPKSIGRYKYPSCAQPSSCSSPLTQFSHFNFIAWCPSPLLLICVALSPFQFVPISSATTTATVLIISILHYLARNFTQVCRYSSSSTIPFPHTQPS